MDTIKKHEIPPSLILNLDETSVEMVCAGNRTYELPTVRQVRLLGANDKRTLTYTPVIASDGCVVLSQIILPGKVKEDEDPEPMWQDSAHLRSHSLMVNHSGGRKQWQNSVTFAKLIKGINAYVESTIQTWGIGSCAILVLDCAGCHKSKAARSILAEYPRLIPLFVPPRMTSVLQLLDVAFFAPFKKYLCNCVGDYLLNCGFTLRSLQCDIYSCKVPFLLKLHREATNIHASSLLRYNECKLMKNDT